MVKYILEEVDVDFGDVLYQEEFTRKRDAYRALERYIRQARKRGWDCDIAPVADYYAYECFKEVDDYVYSRLLRVVEVEK